MSDLPMTLLDLDAAGLDPTQPAPAEFVQFLYDNSRSSYLTLWSHVLSESDGAANINRWIQDALTVYHARALQTQFAPPGDKPAGANVTEVTYSGPTTPAAPVCIDVPYVSGGTAVGDTLSCTMGNWGNEPVSYAYAWSNGGTAASCVVAEGDMGTSITCVVSATNAGGTTASPPSNAVVIPSAVVAAEAEPEAAPVHAHATRREREEAKREEHHTTGSGDRRK